MSHFGRARTVAAFAHAFTDIHSATWLMLDVWDIMRNPTPAVKGFYKQARLGSNADSV